MVLVLLVSRLTGMNWRVGAAAAAALAVFFGLVNRFEPVQRYDMGQSGLLEALIPGVLLFVGVVMVVQVVRTLSLSTIRTNTSSTSQTGAAQQTALYSRF